MRIFSRMVGIATACAALGVSVAAQTTNGAESIDGRWDASLDNHGTQIPFRLDISGSGPTLKVSKPSSLARWTTSSACVPIDPVEPRMTSRRGTGGAL